jgi:hypothetical protein
LEAAGNPELRPRLVEQASSTTAERLERSDVKRLLELHEYELQFDQIANTPTGRTGTLAVHLPAKRLISTQLRAITVNQRGFIRTPFHPTS